MKKISSFKKSDKDSFAQRKKRVIKIIRQIKRFEKSIGFKPTKNFLSYESAGPKGSKKCFYFVYFTPKTVLPYSYDDLRMRRRWSSAKPIDISKIDAKKYDIYSYQPEAVACQTEGTPIRDDLIKSSLARLIYLIIHEDWHDNNNLPTYIDESVAEFISHIGALEFAYQYFPNSYRLHKKLRESFENLLSEREIIISYYQKLEKLYQRFKDGKISLKTTLRRKEKLFKALTRKTGYKYNNASLGQIITYLHYLALMCKLYLALDRDLRAVVYALKFTSRKTGLTSVQRETKDKYRRPQISYRDIKKGEKKFIHFINYIIESLNSEKEINNKK